MSVSTFLSFFLFFFLSVFLSFCLSFLLCMLAYYLCGFRKIVTKDTWLKAPIQGKGYKL